MENIREEIKSSKLSMSIAQDFLTWLWFKSEKNNGQFESPEGEVFGLTMGDKIVVQGGDGEFKESAMSSGKNSMFQEAKHGLRTGKKVYSAKIIIEYNGDEWSFFIKSEDFSITSFKTPKIAKKIQQDEDPDGLFFEKVYLVEKALDLFDSVFMEFLKIKFDPAWEEELEELRTWIKKE